MFGRRNVDLRLSDRAKDWITHYVTNSTVKQPILGILVGAWAGESPKLTLGIYDRAKVYEGWIGVCPDLEFVVINEDIFDQLNGKTLDITESGPTLIAG